jgi:PKD repeat protein
MDQSTSNTTSWLWSFSGGTPSSSTEQNPTVVYENAGTYTVTLVASNNSGATNVTEIDLVTIAPLPSPGFETTIDGSQVIFNNTTTNGNSYFWTFGDGTTSTETNPNHLYPTDGQYDVILTATNECGMMSTEIVTISIVALPAAGFTTATRSGCAPLTVSFQDESSESTSAWDWSFEGGTPATSDEENPTVVYDAPGTYTVVLTVSNSSGMNTLTQIDYIEVFPETVADFDLTTMDDEISIVNNSMNATGYIWSFGDGTTSTEANPTHVYTSSGTYTISLTAVGLCGSVTTTQTVMISVTNILEEEKVSLFEVYPNPGSGKVTVSIEGEPTNDLEIKLIDLLGRVLYRESQNFNGSLIREYDWTNLAAATYIIQLRSGDSVNYRKILIEK